MMPFQQAPPVPSSPNVPSVPALNPGQVTVGGSSLAGPADIFRALKAQREELGDQLSMLNNRRENLAEELEDPMTRGASRTGLEQRITETDARISALDKQIAEADAQVARAASIPGATVRPPEPPRRGPPEEVWPLSALFIIVAILPMSIAFSRRIWRRGAAAGATAMHVPRELLERFSRLEQTVEATSLEVERIGEGQRFVTRVLTESNTARPRELASPNYPNDPVGS